MASSSHQGGDWMDQYAHLDIEGEEEGVLIAEDQSEGVQAFDDRWCLVGVYIKELDTNRYLFQFYHEIDIQTVIDGSPWTFNRMPLVFHRLKRGEDPRVVSLHELDMWVQLHDLKYGFMSEWVVKHAGNYVRTFIKSDAKNFIGIWRDYLRVRVTIDINKPLKRRMKLIKQDGTWIWTTFKYEYVPTFCFICGFIGHSDRFCPRRFDSHFDPNVKPYGEWMKATTRRKNYLIGAQWLRSNREEEGGVATGGERHRNHMGDMDINSADMVRSDGGFSGMEIGGNQGGPWCSGPPIIMSILSWNCHGLGNPWAVRFIKDLVIQKQPKVVFLCETLLKADMLERVRVALGFEGVFSVDARGKSGGVAMLWKQNSDVQLMGYGVNFIDVSIAEENGDQWRLTGLYGEPNRNPRRNTWDQIRELQTRSPLPWCVVGDLNNVTSQSDKRGGNSYPNWLIDGFCTMLDECGLCDMELCGYPYTWEMGRGTSNWIEVRIDRALVSQSWIESFPLAKLMNLEVSTSDHCPIQVVFDVGPKVVGRKKFRFENLWLREPACLQLVKDTWELLSGSSVMEKINYCGEKLLVWGKDYSRNFKERIQGCKAEVRRWKKGRDAVSVENYKKAEARLQEVLIQKEVFWRQRSKQVWLKEGDQNSKYFHAMATSRKRNNSIKRLQNDQGIWIDWENNLPSLMVDYFNNLFTSSSLDVSEVTDTIPSVISEFQNGLLLEPLIDDEVAMSSFQMHSTSLPT
uniref:CCHC-type domain-containing protein n=1 Tax=Cannabis sativa TaxID=3483 RepID=A0A803Q5L9_CANSA